VLGDDGCLPRGWPDPICVGVNFVDNFATISVTTELAISAINQRQMRGGHALLHRHA
jgi:hypothetical protein